MKLSAIVSIAVLIASQSPAQTRTPAPAFEVASVKAVSGSEPGLPPGFSRSPRRSGGRFSWTATPAFLLRYAYNLPDWRIVRMDKNNEQAFYVIDATMDAATTEDQLRLMLRKLLADRFQLASHREAKEVQGYALVTVKNGPKIKAAAPGETHSMPEYFAGKPAAALEGLILVTAEGRGTSALTGRGVSTAQLAETISAELGTFVLDRAGMAGKYYFGFKFLSVGNRPADDVEGSTIFTALQDELGLRLEKHKSTVEILVVDHFEKPSEN